MCGIAGIFALNNKGRDWLRYLEKATRALQLRGPDAEGTFRHGNVGLGHRRLSILDVSESSNQPLFTEDGRYAIVYNGEIFNFKELRKSLRNKGYEFSTQSDTEVLIKLYAHYGEKCLDYLNGFFAFAVYDKQSEKLFLARDRMGIKPLYYYADQNVLVFASSLKAILQFPVARTLNIQSLYLYLQLNYVPREEALIENCHQLLPAQCMEVSKNGIKTHFYYKHPYLSENKTLHGQSYEASQESLRELLDESVRLRLVSDVPLGCFLSGGIDSSIITALASRHTNKLKTFSVGFKDQPFFDETYYAQLVADKFKTDHTVFSLTQDDLYQNLFDVLDSIDQPFADSSAIAVHILCKNTREKVTVALSGDGADELFAGYNKYSAEWQVIQNNWLSKLVKAGGPVWDTLPKSRAGKLSNLTRQLHRYADGAKLSQKDRYLRWCSILNPQSAMSLLTKANQTDIGLLRLKTAEILKHFNHKSTINDVLFADIQMVLPDDMLRKVDMMSMANSLEIRVPFLDHRIVEYAFSIPDHFKINSKIRKRILQDTFRDILPDQLYRRPKQGFEVPILSWFRNDLKEMIDHDWLDSDFIRSQGIFDPTAVEGIRNTLYSKNPGDTQATVWALIVFQHWWKNVLNDQLPDSPSTLSIQESTINQNTNQTKIEMSSHRGLQSTSKRVKSKIESFFDELAPHYDEKYSSKNIFHAYFFNERLEEACSGFDFTQKKILDIGTGTGILYDYLKKKSDQFEFFGNDISHEMLSKSAIPESHKYLGNVYECGIPEMKFDFIFVLGVTTYMSKNELIKNLEYVRDHLEEDGKCIISFTNSHSLDTYSRDVFRLPAKMFQSKNKVLSQDFPIDKYSLRDATDLVEKFGLMLKEVRYLNHTIFPFNILFKKTSVKIAKEINSNTNIGILNFLSSDLLLILNKKL